MQRSSVGSSLTQLENIRPWRPEFGPEGRHFVSGNSLFLYFWARSEAAMGGGGGAQRPVSGGYELKKMCARSVQARTRGKNLLV